jgi:hypothetical protein
MNTFASRIMLVLAVGGLVGLSCHQSRSANHDPIITSLNLPSSVNAGYRTAFICAASDSDGDVLTYEWKCNVGSLSPSTGAAVYWTAPETSGAARIWVTAQDDRDGSDVRYDTVMVNPGTRTIVDWSGAVPAGDYELWYRYFQTGCTVSGTFSADGQDITLLVLDSVNYSRWRYNESCDCEVRIERSSGSSFSAGTSTSGLHCFILDNRYNANPDTSVQISIQLVSP